MSADPALGEYLTSLKGEGGIFNHINLNLYHYAGNNPLRYTDPTGLSTQQLYNNLGIDTQEKVDAFRLIGLGANRLNNIRTDRLNAGAAYAQQHNLVDSNGQLSATDNEADAYRHFTLNVMLKNAFGYNNAKKIGDNHEKYGSSGFGGDKASLMDLWNNSLARKMSKDNPFKSPDDLWNDALSQGLPVTDINDQRLTDWYNRKTANGGTFDGEVDTYKTKSELFKEKMEQWKQDMKTKFNKTGGN